MPVIVANVFVNVQWNFHFDTGMCNPNTKRQQCEDNIPLRTLENKILHYPKRHLAGNYYLTVYKLPSILRHCFSAINLVYY